MWQKELASRDNKEGWIPERVERMGIKDVGDVGDVGVVSSTALLAIKHTFNSASYVMDTKSVLNPRSWNALAYLIDALEVTPCHVPCLNRSNPLVAKVAFESLNLENFSFMEGGQDGCSLL
jgi:hypothetical protein